METTVYVMAGLAAIVAIGWWIELVTHTEGERLRDELAISLRRIR